MLYKYNYYLQQCGIYLTLLVETFWLSAVTDGDCDSLLHTSLTLYDDTIFMYYVVPEIP